MGIRLYDSAWVALRGVDTPQQVQMHRSNPAVFPARYGRGDEFAHGGASKGSKFSLTCSVCMNA